MPEMLKRQGVYTHLTTDHLHYWSDGGAHYMSRFSSHEMARGQGEDPIKGLVEPLPLPDCPGQKSHRDEINRQRLKTDADFPIDQTFRRGLEFIDTNHASDNWMLTIETFDPHEPFLAQERFRSRYPKLEDGIRFDWPVYGGVTETTEEIDHCRLEYAACVTMCDHYLGQVLDAMDTHKLWEDTLLIVTTDHGFFLGERDLWSKGQDSWSPEFAHLPLFIWDPRSGLAGETRQALTQTTDLAPTLLEYFNLEIPPEMLGQALRPVVERDAAIHDAIIWGWYGREIICCDGRHVYVKGTNPENRPLFNYTLEPSHINIPFDLAEELRELTLHEGFSFTRGCPLLKVPAEGNCSGFWGLSQGREVELLFDLRADPGFKQPLNDPVLKETMIRKTVALMHANEAPPEQFERLGLPT